MPAFRLSVGSETESALQEEAEMLGFPDAETYLDWIVANRTAIERGTDDPQLVEDYRDRVAALEERLAAEGVDPATVDGEQVSDATPTSESWDSGSTELREVGTRTESSVDTLHTVADAGSGGPRTKNSDQSAAEQSDSDAPRTASDGGVAASEEFSSMHLRPERVSRVSEDPVAEDADSLADVETNRIDELSRRAVAETRDRLDRDVVTGLNYDASSPLADSDVRPGEDLADLDSLSVPGRSEELVARRRVAVGHALAYLHDEGPARKSDVVESCFEECPAAYETPAGWWRCVRGALQQVEAVDGGRRWSYER